jgi:peptidoglycan/LPS O-acetylase OafA/YrhL
MMRRKTTIASSSEEEIRVTPKLDSAARIPTLDGWRAVAILAVVCTHTRWPRPELAFLGRNGELGVQLFFALSGFLITSRLLSEYDAQGAISWRSFYIRRVFRILPPAFFLLFVLALLGPLARILPINRSELVAAALFYRNYAHPASWYTGHFWSLAVEEHFYLLWPAVLCIVGVARGWRAALSLALLFLVWRHVDSHFNWIGHFNSRQTGNTHRSDYQMAGLFLGCAAAFLWRNKTARSAIGKVSRSWLSLPLVLAALVLVRHPGTWTEDGIDVLMVLLPLVTIADSRGFVSRLLRTELMQWIGRLSYSLYLWQQLFLPYYDAPKGLVQRFPVNIVAAFAAAAFSYYLVERPAIAFGRRLAQKRRDVSFASVAPSPSALSTT